jgi:squalene-hopene/tetraprenyl-beta-curcumene cyclase
VHPYTQARPGGWAWTDLSGGVPDADDTAGALLALRDLAPIDEETRQAAQIGCRWLREVQNRDRGIATFCRGWGRLDFDRSSSDLTAHGVRAWRSWLEDLPPPLAGRLDHCADAAIREFLIPAQREDGAWLALWFGNELAEAEQNPVFGTARVVLALAGADRAGLARQATARAAEYLLRCQRPSGGWGPENPDKRSNTPPESIEETAAAVEALACAASARLDGLDREPVVEAVRRGAARLAELTDEGSDFPAAPIGLYFARLWYYERMYPLVMAISAWGRAERLLSAETVGYNGE